MGDIKVGGPMTGSLAAAGNHNVQKLNISGTLTFSGPDAAERERVLAALQAIHDALGELKGGPSKSAQREAAAALEQAKVQEASKDDIGSALQTALESAKKVAEFATVANTIAPFVQTVATWLGGQWGSLMTLLV